MIINNYNGSLPENTETIMTATKCPVINIRAFDPNLKAGGHLIIPYYVSDFDQAEYRQEKLGPTFTTVFSLDEDTVPAEQLHEPWKQTTYAGEQVIDLGVFDEVGIHTLNVRTIMSNGVASATKLLKFIVHPAGAKTVLDLSTLSGFTGKFLGYQKYIIMTLQVWNGLGPCLKKYMCDYTVTKTEETVGNETKVTDIEIVVSKPTGFTGHCVTNYPIDDDGNINANPPQGNPIDNYLDIEGTYHVATQCVVDGETVNLSDYLGVPISELPREVIQTAAMNKVALTRLFEAAKAWRWKQVFDDLVDELDRPTEEGLAACAVAASDAVKYEFEFKMPKMDIVCDYHYALAPAVKDHGVATTPWTADYMNFDSEGDFMGNNWISLEDGSDSGNNPNNTTETYWERTSQGSLKTQITKIINLRKYYYGRDDIMVPDGMVLNLNGSTLSMLQINNIRSGRMMHLLYNINTHITNGNLVGCYKGVEFAHIGDMESVHLLSVHGCLFCTMEGLDVSWSTGYDLSIGIAQGRGEDIKLSTGSLLLPFNERGYIDYQGQSHDIAGTGLGWYRTSAGGDDGDFVRIYQYGWTVTGREFRVTRYTFGAKSQRQHTKTCREMFVHFYKKEGANQYTFIRTVKVMQRHPVLLPYGATHIKMTMYGTNSDASSMDYLYPNDSSLRFARNFATIGWGNGAKNIRYHDTRTCAFDNGGAQTYMSNIKLYNVALERWGLGLHNDSREDDYYYTKMLVDLEDHAFEMYNWWMDGVEMYFGDSRNITAGRGYDGHMKNCRNIHISWGEDIVDLLVENSAMSITFLHNNHGLGSGSHFIVRNSIVDSVLNKNSVNQGPSELNGYVYLRGNSLFSAPRGAGNGINADDNYNVEEFDTIKL